MAFKMKPGRHPLKFINTMMEGLANKQGLLQGEMEARSESGMDPISTEGMTTPARIDTIEGRVNELSSQGGKGGIEQGATSKAEQAMGGNERNLGSWFKSRVGGLGSQ